MKHELTLDLSERTYNYLQANGERLGETVKGMAEMRLTIDAMCGPREDRNTDDDPIPVVVNVNRFIHKRLAQQAKRNGRTLEDEVLDYTPKEGEYQRQISDLRAQVAALLMQIRMAGGELSDARALARAAAVEKLEGVRDTEDCHALSNILEGRAIKSVSYIVDKQAPGSTEDAFVGLWLHLDSGDEVTIDIAPMDYQPDQGDAHPESPQYHSKLVWGLMFRGDYERGLTYLDDDEKAMLAEYRRERQQKARDERRRD